MDHDSGIHIAEAINDHDDDGDVEMDGSASEDAIIDASIEDRLKEHIEQE